jgi:hypothetical protein
LSLNKLAGQRQFAVQFLLQLKNNFISTAQPSLYTHRTTISTNNQQQ